MKELGVGMLDNWVLGNSFHLGDLGSVWISFSFSFPKGENKKKKNNFKTLIRQFGSAEEPESWKKRVYIRKECDKKNENKKITLIRKSKVNY